MYPHVQQFAFLNSGLNLKDAMFHESMTIHLGKGWLKRENTN